MSMDLALTLFLLPCYSNFMGEFWKSRILSCALIGQFLVAYAPDAFAKKPLVVIDPGHGGTDTGAKIPTGHQNPPFITEKHLVLLLARDLSRELIIRGFDVILTRNEDREVLLSERTALANRLKADVFVSLHLNSTDEKMSVGGIETFVLNQATDHTSKRLADLENAVLKESKAKEMGGAHSSDVSLIMKDLILDANLEPSRKVACHVQSHIRNTAKDRGVKQALFYVLMGADMPSILIEAGFMNVKEDLDRVLMSNQRMRLAAEIARGLEDYQKKKKVEACMVRSDSTFKRKDDAGFKTRTNL